MRHPRDYYRTASWITQSLFRAIDTDNIKTLLDPCAGDGAILREVPKHIRVHAIEIEETSAIECYAAVGDALELDWPAVDMIVMNPPFFLLGPILLKAINTGAITWMFCRAAAIWPKREREFLAERPPRRILLLPNRPRFKPDGTTDPTEYLWAGWNTPKQGITQLPPVDAEKRKESERESMAIQARLISTIMESKR